MSAYRIHFTYEKKEVVLLAKSLDMTHPYFVSIKEIELPKSSPLIIDPNRDTMEKHFGEAYHLMIPFQSVSLIEEIKDEPKKHKESRGHLSMVQKDDEYEDEPQ